MVTETSAFNVSLLPGGVLPGGLHGGRTCRPGQAGLSPRPCGRPGPFRVRAPSGSRTDSRGRGPLAGNGAHGYSSPRGTRPRQCRHAPQARRPASDTADGSAAAVDVLPPWRACCGPGSTPSTSTPWHGTRDRSTSAWARQPPGIRTPEPPPRRDRPRRGGRDLRRPPPLEPRPSRRARPDGRGPFPGMVKAIADGATS